MPTLNQLVKRNRSKATKKSKAIALTRGFNSILNKPIFYTSPQKRGVCIKVTTKTPKKPKLTPTLSHNQNSFFLRLVASYILMPVK